MPTIVPIAVGGMPDDGTGDSLRAGGQKVNNSFSSVNTNALYNSDTGVINWGGFSIDPGNATFTNESGSGQIINNEMDPDNPTETVVSWSQTTLIAPKDIATQTIGFIMINSAGLLFQQNMAPTPQQRRENIVLGLWATADKITITALQDQVGSSLSKHQTVMDVLRSIGLLKSGLVVSGNGVNLSIDISTGTLFSPGINYSINKSNPNILALTGQVLKSFFRATQTGILTGGTVTVIDPASSDVGGVVTVIAAPGNKATNQLVFQFPSGNVIIMYGQTIHATLNDAIQESDKESIIIPAEISSQGVLIGVLSVRADAADLTSSAEARLLTTGLTGSLAGGASGVPVGTLQNILDNSTQPQATTKPATGPIQFQQGTGADTDNVVEILNDAGTTKFSVNGKGDTSVIGLILGRTGTNVSGTFGVNESIVGVDTSGGPITITLATAAIANGKWLDIKDESGNAQVNNVTIATEATETIDTDLFGAIKILTNHGIVRVYSDGSNWFTR